MGIACIVLSFIICFELTPLFNEAIGAKVKVVRVSELIIKGELITNGVNNNLKHTKGVISMARSQSPNSAGSQFFIMHEDSTHLDGQYAGFGKVVEGIDVVDEIAETSTSYGDKPVVEQKIESVTVETKGVEYPEPEKM